MTGSSYPENVFSLSYAGSAAILLFGDAPAVLEGEEPLSFAGEVSESSDNCV